MIRLLRGAAILVAAAFLALAAGCARPPAPVAVAGLPCSACGKDLTWPLLLCSACEAPHHPACWPATGRCARAGCAGAPPIAPPAALDLELDSGRESVALFLALLCGLGALYSYRGPRGYRERSPWWPVGLRYCSRMGLVLFLLWWALDDYRTLDARTRRIVRCSTFLGISSRSDEASFGDGDRLVLAYGISGRRYRVGELWLLFKDGTALSLFRQSRFVWSRQPEPTTLALQVRQILGIPVGYESQWTPPRLR